MYPRDGGYKEQYYAEEYVVEEDVKGPTMHMMMKPRDHGQHHGYGGSHIKNKAHHGYGGHHDDHHHKNGVESYSAQYAEKWIEKERPWNVGNDHYGHGHTDAMKHNGYGAHDGPAMKHRGYGAHEGHYGPHQEIRAPVWKFKGISD